LLGAARHKRAPALILGIAHHVSACLDIDCWIALGHEGISILAKFCGTNLIAQANYLGEDSHSTDKGFCGGSSDTVQQLQIVVETPYGEILSTPESVRG